ncbi:hypothetical protein AAFF27_18910 [Xylophilus sp. GW821-FHT01B05]
MKTTDEKRSSQRLAAVHPQAMERYQRMRALVMPAPGVDPAQCEVVLAMQLGVLGLEVPFKVHAMRAMALHVTHGQLQGLLLRA